MDASAKDLCWDWNLLVYHSENDASLDIQHKADP